MWYWPSWRPRRLLALRLLVCLSFCAATFASAPSDILSQTADKEAEIRRLEQLVSAYPDRADTWYELGLAYWRLGRHAEAVKALSEAVRLKPDAMGFRIDLGNALDDAGRPEEAIIQYLAGPP